MALTQISTGGVKNDAVTAGKIPADAVGQSEIADEAVDEARLQISNAGTNGQFLSKQSGDTGGLTWATPPDTNTQVGGSTGVDFNDNVKARFGTGNDLEIYHAGGEDQIRGTGTKFEIRSPNLQLQNSAAEKYIACTSDGSVDIYYDNSKKLETTSSGINVTGQINVNGSALSAAPEVELVADGSISANQAVIINSDGKAASVTGFNSSLGLHSTQVSAGYIASSDYLFQLAEDTNTGRMVAIWKNQGGSHGTRSRYRVGTRTGTTVTWGTEANLSDSNITSDDMAIAAFDTDKFFLFYKDGGDSHYYARIMTTTSNNTASFGTKVVATDMSNNNRGYCYAPQLGCKGDGTGGVLIAYGTSGGNPDGHLVGRYATISGTSITLGSEVTVQANQPEFLDSTYDEGRNTLWLNWKYSNNQPQAVPIKQPSSGTTVLVGNMYNIYHSSGSTKNSLVWDPDHQVFWWFYRVGNQLYYKANEFSSGSTGNGQVYPTGSSHLTVAVPNNNSANAGSSDDFYILYQKEKKRIILMWQDSSNEGHYIEGTATGTVGDKESTITWDQSSRVDDFSYWRTYQAKPQHGKSSALVSVNRDVNGYMKLLIKQFSATDADKFIGFSSAAYTNGQTAKINVVGNTTTQSSLTPGQRYYVQDNGTLGTSAGLVTAEAGIALSSTKLLIKG